MAPRFMLDTVVNARSEDPDPRRQRSVSALSAITVEGTEEGRASAPSTKENETPRIEARRGASEATMAMSTETSDGRRGYVPTVELVLVCPGCKTRTPE